GTVIVAGRLTRSLGSFMNRLRTFSAIATLLVVISACEDTHDPGRTAEKTAIQSASHPYAGFWKQPGCADNFGLAIAPAGPGIYSVSFCGPGGCFKPGTYRPNTPIVGDSDYRVIDQDTIEVSSLDGFSRYVRCKSREAA